jgi:hypothetical protein
MSKEYVCPRCKHLQPSKIDLMECELQVVRYLTEDKNTWVYDPVCIHDAECEARKHRLMHIFNKDVSNYDVENNLTNLFAVKESESE